MSKTTDIEKRYEQLEEAVAYLLTVEENVQTAFKHSIQNEIHALSTEHAGLHWRLCKLEKANDKLAKENQDLKQQLEEQLAKKKKPYVKFIPCTCGCNRRRLWCGSPCNSTESYWYYECVKCGFKSDKAPSAAKAKLAWNEVMKDCQEQVDEFIKGDI